MGEVETIQAGSSVSNLTHNLLKFLRTVGFTFLNNEITNGLEVCHILEMFKRIKRCPRMFVDCLLGVSSGQSPRAGSSRPRERRASGKCYRLKMT